MRRLIILGNCVAQRLAQLLEKILVKYNSSLPPLKRWELVAAPPVYNLSAFSQTPQDLASLARQCDIIFTQPLFNFGPLNTESLRQLSGITLHTFSAPNFDAYFPDIIHPKHNSAEEKYPPPLEWHSRIFLECKAASIPAENLEKIYLNHPLFNRRNMIKALDKSWSLYEKREKDVEIGTMATVREFYNLEPLFFTWKHPGDRIISRILSGMLLRLGMSQGEIDSSLSLIDFLDSPDQPQIWSKWGFGFNAWPVISRNHNLFNFKGREFFRVAGQNIDILTAYIAWSNYYDEHPAIFKQLLESLVS